MVSERFSTVRVRPEKVGIGPDRHRGLVAPSLRDDQCAWSPAHARALRNQDRRAHASHGIAE